MRECGKSPSFTPNSENGNWGAELAIFTFYNISGNFQEASLCQTFPLPERIMGFPGGSDGKESACNAGDPGSIPGSGRSPGEGNGSPLQCSCLENTVHRGAWWATVLGVAKNQTRLKRLACTQMYYIYSTNQVLCR